MFVWLRDTVISLKLNVCYPLLVLAHAQGAECLQLGLAGLCCAGEGGAWPGTREVFPLYMQQERGLIVVNEMACFALNLTF